MFFLPQTLPSFEGRVGWALAPSRAYHCVALFLRLFAERLLGLCHLVKLGFILGHMIVFRGYTLIVGRHQLVGILL